MPHEWSRSRRSLPNAADIEFSAFCPPFNHSLDDQTRVLYGFLLRCVMSGSELSVDHGDAKVGSFEDFGPTFGTNQVRLRRVEEDVFVLLRLECGVVGEKTVIARSRWAVVSSSLSAEVCLMRTSRLGSTDPTLVVRDSARICCRTLGHLEEFKDWGVKKEGKGTP